MFRLYVLIMALLWSIFVIAHHSLANNFDESKLFSFELVIEEFRFINPHPFINASLVSDSSVVWNLEMDNRRELLAIGFTDTTLVPGDIIVVTGHPSNHDSATIFLKSLEHSRLGFRYEHNMRQPLF